MSGVLSFTRQHRGLAIAASILLIVIAAVVVGGRLFAGSGGIVTRDSHWYTTDDGASWFADKANRMPFEVSGKPAYRVHVFDDGSGTSVAGYLERLNPRMAKQIVQLRGSAEVPSSEQMISYGRIASAAREVKRPGDSEASWVRVSSGEAAKVMSMRGRAKGPGEVVEVFP